MDIRVETVCPDCGQPVQGTWRPDRPEDADKAEESLLYLHRLTEHPRPLSRRTSAK